MPQPLPLLLVPGLLCSARLYGHQIAALWRFGPIMVANHRWDDEIGAVARRILDAAPPRFALAGLSYGGYIALAMMRQAPERIEKLALLDTSARPDTAEQKAARLKLMAMAESGQLPTVVEQLTPRLLHRDHAADPALLRVVRGMAQETGADAFLRQERAIMSRPDSRRLLPHIHCPTLVVVGDGDELTPPELSQEIAAGIPGAKLVVVPNSGHLSTIERPDVVNAALADWLASPAQAREPTSHSDHPVVGMRGTIMDVETAGVIAPPPLLALGAIVLGLLLDWLAPAYVLSVLLSWNVRVIFGLALIAASLGLAIPAVLTFRAAGTHVEPWKSSRALVTHGIFQWLRNPMYVGLTASLVGLALLLASDWMMVMTIVFALTIHYGVVLREERYLEARFGDAYRGYKAVVPRYGWRA